MVRLSALFAVVFALAGAVPASAEIMTTEQYEAKLKSYDAETVAAARSYAKTFHVMDAFAKSAPMMLENLGRSLKAKNPDITADQTKLFVDTFQRVALVDSADAIDHALILGLLDVLSKDELTALDQFYSSPVGQSILAKFPAMSERLADVRKLMKTDIVPHAIDAAKAKLKESGVDVKM